MPISTIILLYSLQYDLSPVVCCAVTCVIITIDEDLLLQTKVVSYDRRGLYSLSLSSRGVLSLLGLLLR